MSLNVTLGSTLVLTFVDSSVRVTLPFSFPFETDVEVMLNAFGSADTEDVECLFDLVLVAARILCSRDDRRRLNVLG